MRRPIPPPRRARRTAAVVAGALAAVLAGGLTAPAAGERRALPPPELVPAAAGGAPGRSVWILGDSVLRGAEDEIRAELVADRWSPTFFHFPGLPLSEGVRQAEAHRAEIGEVVVVHLGNNLPGTVAEFRAQVDDMMRALVGVDHVFWLTIQVFVPSRADVDAALADAAADWPNLELVDWAGAVEANPGWAGRTDPHLSGAGRVGMADLIGDRLDALVAAEPPCPVPGGGASRSGPLGALGALAAATPVWTLDGTGAIAAHGAPALGDLPGAGVAGAATAMAPTVTGDGYWILTADGAVFSFGAARYAGGLGGSLVPGLTAVALAADPDGTGYWIATSDGRLHPFEAPDLQPAGPPVLDRPVTAAAVAAGGGYWLATDDGAVHAVGAPAHGGFADLGLCFPPVPTSLQAAPGGGYWALGDSGTWAGFGAPDPPGGAAPDDAAVAAVVAPVRGGTAKPASPGPGGGGRSVAKPAPPPGLLVGVALTAHL